jgi:dihydroorotate dehydrogenase (fumarate)
MDLSTTYLGLKLKNPVVAAASPLSREISTIRALEDAGTAAVVMHSLFEEQLRNDAAQLEHYLEHGTESYREALTYFPHIEEFQLGPEEYLEHIRKAKEAVGIPIIGSLNGVSHGGWIDYAKKIESAGADALELNVYFIPTDPKVTGTQVEQVYIDILRAVKAEVKIPVAMKLSPFFSAPAAMAKALDENGVDGLVLFNRFYQPDIDLENLEPLSRALPSSPQAMRVPMRWIAILFGRIKADLAATSGIYTGEPARPSSAGPCWCMAPGASRPFCATCHCGWQTTSIPRSRR